MILILALAIALATFTADYTAIDNTGDSMAAWGFNEQSTTIDTYTPIWDGFTIGVIELMTFGSIEQNLLKAFKRTLWEQNAQYWYWKRYDHDGGNF